MNDHTQDEHVKDEARTAGEPIAVVGIGASAQAFRSLEKFFALMPRDSGAAFIVVSESKDPLDIQALVEAIGLHGSGAMQIAQDMDRLEPGRIYVTPVGAMTTLEGGRLRISSSGEKRGHHGTVDTFLISLAEQQTRAAVGIILAAEKSSGSLGVARLKECGGLALAEAEAQDPAPDPEVIDGAAGMADIRVPLEEIPVRLLQFIVHLRGAEEGPESRNILTEGESRLPAIATILRNRTGHDFHGYKANTFLRRIQRRMHVVRIDSIDEYVEKLRSDPEEVQDLFQDLLIGVTQFFRDPAEFNVLERQVLPELLKGRRPEDPLRVWVLGCSTGEEAYSLGMLIREATATMDAPPHVQIFATDIDARALAVARAGRYPETIVKDIPPERLARWFVKEGGTYCIHKDLREMCIFSQHNVIKDAPFSRVDLVSCRNMLIYLNADLQERVIPLFHFALRPGGFLFLGPSENVTRHPKLFQPIDRKHRIFRRQETSSRILPEFPLTARSEPRHLSGDRTTTQRQGQGTLVSKRAERVVERYTPAYVIVDDEYQVLNFSGRTGPFLDPSSGVANLNLLNLVHRDLRLDLRAALHRAAADRKPARVSPLRMGAEGEARRVGLTVEPLAEAEEDATNFVVLFQDYGADHSHDADDRPINPSVLRDEHVVRLESELRITKGRLQATIEELESTNEELKSSNEEYQSINEELQSANEELETSKEELQSVNEELQTVNGELAHRVGELARTNSDLKNLLEATQIATLFLDNDLRVKSFTPSMSEVFHLIESDLGRPIAHIAPRVPYPDLQEDVRRVLRTLSTIEREIGAPERGRYLVRVLPYRSVDNFIAGTVLTFLDITATTVAQAARQAAEERARLATAAARITIWEMKAATGQITHSEGFESAFGFPPPQTLEALLATTHPEDRDQLAAAFDDTLNGQSPLDKELRILGSRQEVWVRLSGTATDGGILGVMQDIDARRRAEGQQSLLLAELQHRVKNILAVVRNIAARSIDSSQTLEEFSDRFFGRIDALARTQGVLANRGADGLRLDELLRRELAVTVSHDSEQAEISGPPILLKDKAAEAMSLAIHELTTNAVKYGALSQPNGRLAVNWRVMNVSTGGRLTITWIERGVDMPEAKPVRIGFGRRLIERGLPYDLGATTGLDFTADGVSCALELPLGQHVIALDEGEVPHSPTP
ncbi:PAS domain-containing protein [Roseomonas sp. ACRSG]|nr:PAS domain-containing protein [Roseomonas sp. ACRSG]